MTDDTFTIGMARLSEMWPERQITGNTYDAYWTALHHIDDDVFFAVITRALRTCTFFPKAAELERLARAILAEHDLLPMDESDAWAQALTAIKSSDARHCAPLVQQVIRELGGARHLGQQDQSSLDYTRRDFEKRYRELRDRMLDSDLTYTSQALPSGSVTAKLEG